MVKLVPVSFRNHKGLLLRGVVHEPKQYTHALIWCHGFPGSMNGGTPRRFIRELAKHNVVCLRFSFSCSPPSQGRFEDKLKLDEAKDIKYAVTFMASRYPGLPIIVCGHSSGAFDAALFAHTDKRIAGLILAGGIVHLDELVHCDFTDRQVYELNKRGWTYYDSLSLKRHATTRNKIRKPFYDEHFTLDVPKAIRRYKKPLLVLHGDADEIVPLSQGRLLYGLANKPKKLVIVKGADHRFINNQKAAISAVLSFIRSL